MNLSYYRKSKFSLEQTKERLVNEAKKSKIQILGTTELDNANGTLVTMCKKDWLDKLLSKDKNVVGVIPCNVFIYEENDKVFIGVGNASVVGGVSGNEEVQKLSLEIERALTQFIDMVSDAGELKATGVTLYSTMSCPYCSMEKEWLEDNKIEHEVIYVDQNPQEAQKLVEATGQMGVPVTKIDFEDMESQYVIGFNKAQLAKLII